MTTLWRVSRALLLGCLISSFAGAQDVALSSALQFKHAEELLAQQRYEESAAEFTALVAKYPKSELADSALYDAAVAYEKAGKGELALSLYQRVVDEYPNSRLADQALFRVAVTLERTMNFERAIERYEALLASFPTARAAPNAAHSIARLHEGLMHYPQAGTAYERYARLFPKAGDAADLQFRAAKIYRHAGAAAEERKALETFLTKKFARKEAASVSEAKARLKELEKRREKD